MVGTKTVIDDNPSLTTRDWAGNNPIRIVLDQNNRISKESHIFDNQAKTILLNNDTINFNNNIAQEIVDFLFNEGIQSVIIEGGSKTLQTFIDANLWDEARVFKSNVTLNEGVKAPKIEFKKTTRNEILEDELLIFFNYDNNNYF